MIIGLKIDAAESDSVASIFIHSVPYLQFTIKALTFLLHAIVNPIELEEYK
ncbi:hypothetical protein [Paenibacillus terrigena]|uniref:hypothetical protein n=1 Tax=Paenibacillus terrigena TaxID=369333 RepID=UPI000373FD70|nr:hypothetical protein [Paenibacillus terrigena]